MELGLERVKEMELEGRKWSWLVYVLARVLVSELLWVLVFWLVWASGLLWGVGVTLGVDLADVEE